MFTQLTEMGLDFKVYFELAPCVLAFKDMRTREALSRMHPLRSLYTDLTNGTLPAYSWVEPRYFDTPGGQLCVVYVTEYVVTISGVLAGVANDQHPDHDVSAGDQLIKDIYEAVRASPLWEKTALVITYDEHGGFYDHVPPPTGVPNPDGKNATDDPFDFTRLGVRVPFVVASPWIKKGVY